MSQQTIEEIKKNLPDLSVHPAVKLPMMNEDELKGLEFDLLKNGQRVPIWIIDGMIYDGRSKYNVFQRLREEGRLKVEPDIREWSKAENENLEDILLSLNVHRKGYNSQQRAAYATKYLLEAVQEDAEKRMNGGKEIVNPGEIIPEGQKGRACTIVALMVGSNEKYVQQCSKIKDKNENFLDFIINKKMTIQEGLSLINLEQDLRNHLFAQMKADITYKEAYAKYQEQPKEEQKPRPKKKKPVNVLDYVFFSNVDEKFLDEVATLYRKYHPQKNIPNYDIWDIEKDEELATKISNVSKFVEKNGRQL